MVKHCQRIRHYFADKLFSVSDHFVGLVVNPFLDNVVKWQFYNIMHERVKGLRLGGSYLNPLVINILTHYLNLSPWSLSV